MTKNVANKTQYLCNIHKQYTDENSKKKPYAQPTNRIFNHLAKHSKISKNRIDSLISFKQIQKESKIHREKRVTPCGTMSTKCISTGAPKTTRISPKPADQHTCTNTGHNQVPNENVEFFLKKIQGTNEIVG